MEKFPAEEYALPFFKESGYVRKLCPKCGSYFWTLNPNQETCGEARPEGCAYYTFIGTPPTRKSYNLREMRETFLSFFEKRGHKRIKPYPVVARWRDDIYLTHASIIDFQPYVTEGIAPPPANPLVIAQPCIRLVDITNTGPTFGKYITIFEMGGHHAFNYPDKEVYWKDQTVRYHDEFVKELGIKPEEVVYKEEIWSGGGNAGPCLECIVRGLEVATLVFMQYKVVGDRFVKLPIRTVDTGYGIERYTWLSQGAPSAFHAIYDDLLEEIFRMAGIGRVDEDLLSRVAKFSSLMSLDKTVGRLEARRKIAQLIGMDAEELDRKLFPIENAFAVADHTKCLTFILSEGVVPSNIQEGYLARLLFRRIYRLLRMLGITDRLYDVVELQINRWSKDYPHIREMRDEIMEMLSVEEEKFRETITRGENLVKRMAGELKTTGAQKVPVETFIELYDSHGIPPEIVKEVAEKEGLTADVPENFYALIAERHMQTSKLTEEVKAEGWIENEVADLPETEALYYKDQYMKEFEAKVLKVVGNEYVVLDGTCFYPEGGGQPADSGYLTFDGGKAEVVNVQKVGKVIVHKIGGGAVPREGTFVKGVIDWDRRYSLMKSHTATHIINSAARRVLGQHVWQFGTQKGVESSRLDISHYRRLTREEVQKIEALANEAVLRNIPVEISWMPRSEAESLYGFRLYQGGAVPGREIRVVKIGDWEVEACGGTHVKNTGEIGFIKIVHSERIQDGVERLVYALGVHALKAVQRNEELLWRVSEVLNAPLEKLGETAEKLVKELKEANAERRRLIREIARLESLGAGAKVEVEAASEIDGVKLVKRDFKEDINVERMVQTASEMVKKDEATVALFYGSDGKTARIMVMAGKEALEKGVNAAEMVKEASALIGGGGGGRPGFAQGGGTIVGKLQEAVMKAEETLRRQVKRQS
ncbi:MAG: alanine--tRNA ligase [Nitrososphaerota archaeon]|nr:alanine--tRNA ligase [Candidatus Bathyarchaeota archaeon]MDW8022648.1 alanine--tRNA ligase [Nitrososphaerota archaeon]